MTKAQIDYYFDADILGLAKIVMMLRSDVTYPGDLGGVIHNRERPPCFIYDTNVKDHVWIPRVADRGWSIITRDKRILDKTAERKAVLEHKAKVLTLVGEGAMTKWGQLEILMCRWRDIEKLGSDTGPFIYALYRTSYNSLL